MKSAQTLLTTVFRSERGQSINISPTHSDKRRVTPVSSKDRYERHMNSYLPYKKAGKMKDNRQSADSEDCLYCPLRKPVFWPIVFLLFVLGPFVFSSNISNTSSNPRFASSPSCPQTNQASRCRRQGFFISKCPTSEPGFSEIKKILRSLLCVPRPDRVTSGSGNHRPEDTPVGKA